MNFGIPMGMTCIGLAEQMRKNAYPWPEIDTWVKGNPKRFKQAQEQVCQNWIEQTIEAWQIEGYLEQKKAEARRDGFVRDMWGRIRYLPSVLSPNLHVREEALRQAQSFPMQAGARGVMKQIEKVVWDEVIRPSGGTILPLLDIHDDLLLEGDEVHLKLVAPDIRDIFQHTVKGWPIPIVCSQDLGTKWSEL